MSDGETEQERLRLKQMVRGITGAEEPNQNASKNTEKIKDAKPVVIDSEF